MKVAMVKTRKTTRVKTMKVRSSKRSASKKKTKEPKKKAPNDNVPKKTTLEEEKLWEVDEIIGHRKHRGRDEYLIKWKGYDETSWEPLKNLNSMAEQAAVRYVAEKRLNNKRLTEEKNADKLRPVKKLRRDGEGEGERLRKEKEIVQIAAAIKDLAMEGKETEVEKLLSENEARSDIDFNHYMAHELNNSCVWKELSNGEEHSEKSIHELDCSWHDDTPLTAAAQNGDVDAVLGLLSTGLCDPTLESACPIDSVQHTALSAVENMKLAVQGGIASILNGNGEPPADSGKSYIGNFGYIIKSKKALSKEEIARFAREKAAETIEKLHRIELVECLLKVALDMWPKASYSDPRAGDGRERNVFSNRMHGVADANSQCLKRKYLKKKLQRASKSYKMSMAVDENCLRTAIENVNNKKKSPMRK